jgi:hypothetical protein
VLPGKSFDEPDVPTDKTNTYQVTASSRVSVVRLKLADLSATCAPQVMLAWDAASTFSCFFYPAGGM